MARREEVHERSLVDLVVYDLKPHEEADECEHCIQHPRSHVSVLDVVAHYPSHVRLDGGDASPYIEHEVESGAYDEPRRCLLHMSLAINGSTALLASPAPSCKQNIDWLID